MIPLCLAVATHLVVAQDSTTAPQERAKPADSTATGAIGSPAQDNPDPNPEPNPAPTPPAPDPSPDPGPAPTPAPGPDPSPAPSPTPMPDPGRPPEPQPETPRDKLTTVQVSAKESDRAPLHPVANTPADPHVKKEARRVPEYITRKAPRINPKIKITKVHDFRNDDNYHPDKNDALQFEKDYWSWGTITNEEIANIKGQYFVITWVNNGERSDFKTRFEYRQVNSKSTVRSLMLDHPQAKGATRSTFAVVGAAYKIYGQVYAWRFTVSRGDEVVASDQSFIW
jgi:hypothetical protein